MKKFLTTALSILILLTMAYMPAAAADRGNMTLEVREFGGIMDGNDYDEWEIDLSQDGNLTIRITVGGSEGTDAESLGSLERAYVSVLDDTRAEISREPFESLPFVVTEELKSGLYYVRVDKFADEEYGSYYIEASFQSVPVLPEPGSTAALPDPELAQTGTGNFTGMVLYFVFGVCMVVVGGVLIKRKYNAS